MQGEPRQAPETADVAVDLAFTVGRISQNLVAEVVEMAPDLVPPTCEDLRMYQ